MSGLHSRPAYEDSFDWLIDSIDILRLTCSTSQIGIGVVVVGSVGEPDEPDVVKQRYWIALLSVIPAQYFAVRQALRFNCASNDANALAYSTRISQQCKRSLTQSVYNFPASQNANNCSLVYNSDFIVSSSSFVGPGGHSDAFQISQDWTRNGEKMTTTMKKKNMVGNDSCCFAFASVFSNKSD